MATSEESWTGWAGIASGKMIGLIEEYNDLVKTYGEDDLAAECARVRIRGFEDALRWTFGPALWDKVEAMLLAQHVSKPPMVPREPVHINVRTGAPSPVNR